MAVRFSIKDRFKELEVAPPDFTDFTTIANGEIDVAEVLTSGWSPYCFADGVVTFVKLEGDLALAPFVYLTQFRKATELAQVDAAEIIAASQNLAMPTVAAIYSIGRCGTTLANHVLNGSDEIWCLSEPDVLDGVAQWDGAVRAELMQALAKILFAQRSKADAHTFGIKLRSQSLFCAASFEEAFPNAKNIFMYRDAIGWANSFFAFIGKFGLTGPFSAEITENLWTILIREPTTELLKIPEMQGNEVDPGHILALAWLRQLETYSKLRETGMKFHPIRYNEFNADRLAGVRDLMRACGLSPDAAECALSAFEGDSQAGTFMEQNEKPQQLSEAHKVVVRAVLEDHPVFSDAGHLLL